MPQTLIANLEQVCRRRQQRKWLAAVLWALVALMLAALGMVGLDRALGVNDTLGRCLLSAAYVVAASWIIRRSIRQAAADRVTPLHIAHEVEQRYPELRDTIASAWEFTQQSDEDPTAGSDALRRAVVLRASAAVESFDWQQFIPRKPLQQAAIAMTGLVIVVGVLGWWVPQALGIGLTRLANPLSDAEWPREHDLELVDCPTLLAAGTDLAFTVRDTRQQLPGEVTIEYRWHRQGRWHEEKQSLSTIGDSLEVRRASVQQSFQVRAVGGDHRTMPWHPVEVVAPPRVQDLHVTVHPPTYTKLPARLLDEDPRVFAGSSLALAGSVDQPIERVVLVGDEGTRFPTRLNADGTGFQIDAGQWLVERTDRYSIELTTLAGLAVRTDDEIAVDVVVDKSPQVRFIEPSADLDVLPTATIPLAIEAQDELSVRKVELVFQRSDRSDVGEQRLPLWHADDQRVATSKQLVRHQLDLRTWQLEPGGTVELQAQATDAQPMTGQSVRPLRLTIISADDLWEKILLQRSQLVERLTQTLREQHDLFAVSVEWSEQPNWSADRWQRSSHSALFRQRQIRDALGGGDFAVVGQIRKVLETIERNGLVRAEEAERLVDARNRLQGLMEGPLTTVEDSLGRLVRQSRRSTASTELPKLVAATVRQQQEVVTGLRDTIDLLMPDNLLGRLERDLAAIESDQRALVERCQNELVPQMLDASSNAEERDESLASAVRNQRELARRLSTALLDMSQVSDRVADNQPTVAARLSETVALAGELATQSSMQASSDQLSRQRLGRATVLQQQALEGLAKLRARLAGQDAQNAAERFVKLQSTERELQRLRRELQKHEDELRKLTPEERQRQLERLRRQREQLAEEAEKISRKLERLRMPQAAKAAAEAAEQLRRASLDRQSAKQAKQKLDTAQRQLTTERRRQQVALARLQMAQLDKKLKALVAQQQAIGEELTRLQTLQREGDGLSDAQLESVRQLGLRQLDLRDEVAAQADALTTLPVFVHLLKAAGRTMQDVEDRLQQSDLSSTTEQLIAEVLHQLTQISAAVEREQQEMSPNQRDGTGGGGQQGGDTPQGQTLQLALGQLRLLKTLQTELLDETRALESERTDGKPINDQAVNERSRQLAERQLELTELARQLTPEPPDPPTTDTESNIGDQLDQLLEESLSPTLNEANQ